MSDHEDIQESLPPNAIASEHALLGSILVAGAASISRVIDLVAPEEFYRPQHKTIFKAACAMYRHGLDVDAITVANSLCDQDLLDAAGGKEYLWQLTEANAGSGLLETYAGSIRTKYLVREAIRQKENADLNSPDDVAALAKTLHDIAEARPAYISRGVAEILLDEFNDIEHRAMKPTYPSSGYADLDRKIFGLQGKKLIIVGGRPGMGKTTLVLNILDLIAEREKVPSIFFSLEMSEQEIAQKIFAMRGGIPLSDIITAAPMMTKENQALLTNVMAQYAESPMKVIDKNCYTVAAMRSISQRQTRKPRVIGIDFMQLIKGRDEKGKNRNDIVTEIAYDLKLWAKEEDVCIIALAQLTRGVEGRQEKRPMMSDLRDSGNIEAAADAVALVYRDEYYNEASTENGTIEINVAKNRMGETGVVKLGSNMVTGRFHHLEERSYSFAPQGESKYRQGYGAAYAGHPYRDD